MRNNVTKTFWNEYCKYIVVKRDKNADFSDFSWNSTILIILTETISSKNAYFPTHII